MPKFFPMASPRLFRKMRVRKGEDERVKLLTVGKSKVDWSARGRGSRGGSLVLFLLHILLL